jgi:drug/metabolite transporter (DMT)-like permease
VKPAEDTRAADRSPLTFETRGLLALVTGAVCIGFAAIWVRWSEVGPIATAFHRLALALPFLALWAYRERPKPPTVTTPVPDPNPPLPPSASGTPTRWILAAGVLFALDLSAWHISILHTTVANATLLGNLAPIFVTLGAWIFLRERVKPRFFLALAIALAGAWLLTGARLGGPPQQLRGDLLALITAVFYGGYQLCVARLRRSLPPGKILFWSSVVCAPVLGVLALAAGEPLWPTTLRAWGVLLGLTVTAQLLGQGLITYGFAHLPAGFSSLTLLVQPIVAAFAGWWIFSESLTPLRALGGLNVLLALLHARR